MSGARTTHEPSVGRRVRRRARTALVAGVVTVVLAAGAVACGGGGNEGDGSDAATPATTVPSDVVVATDPTVPVTVEVGHRFAIVLPADPGDGWRWVVQPFDTALLVALGSEFRDDEQQRIASTAATSTTSTTIAGRTTATSTTMTTSPTANPDESTTTTTSMPPLVQIVSFAGRAPGTATLSFSATQIVPVPDARPTVVTWTVQVTAATTTTR